MIHFHTICISYLRLYCRDRFRCNIVLWIVVPCLGITLPGAHCCPQAPAQSCSLSELCGIEHALMVLGQPLARTFSGGGHDSAPRLDSYQENFARSQAHLYCSLVLGGVVQKRQQIVNFLHRIWGSRRRAGDTSSTTCLGICTNGRRHAFIG